MAAVSLLETPIMTSQGVIYGYDMLGNPVFGAGPSIQTVFGGQINLFGGKTVPRRNTTASSFTDKTPTVSCPPSKEEIERMADLFKVKPYSESEYGDAFTTPGLLIEAVKYSWKHGLPATLNKPLSFFKNW